MADLAFQILEEATAPQKVHRFHPLLQKLRRSKRREHRPLPRERELQIKQRNAFEAITADDVISETGKPNIVKGSGGWKKWRPAAILRAAFTPPHLSAAAASWQMRKGKQNCKGMVVLCQQMLAKLLREGQAKQIDNLFGECNKPQVNFLLLRLMWDETEMKFALHNPQGQWQSPCYHSCMISHGNMEWQDKNGITHHESVICTPCCLTDKSLAQTPHK